MPERAKLVGLPGRLAPKKGHEVFLQAAATLAAQRPGVRFVCVGTGTERYAHELRRRAADLGLSDRVVWAGERHDMAAVYSALDLACCPSVYGEGFPNVVAEAMACEVPCVASDSGDAARIVGQTGTIVPPGDAAVLARAIGELLDRDSLATIGAAARRRVVESFGIDAAARNTERLLAAVAGGPAPKGSRGSRIVAASASDSAERIDLGSQQR